jgi:hypothetical protein
LRHAFGAFFAERFSQSTGATSAERGFDEDYAVSNTAAGASIIFVLERTCAAVSVWKFNAIFVQRSCAAVINGNNDCAAFAFQRSGDFNAAFVQRTVVVFRAAI